MIKMNQEQKAELFQRLHREEGMFVIPNSWDAGSSYIYEKEGFSCVATSSAGVAYALGYPDGEDITLDDLVQVVANTVRRVNLVKEIHAPINTILNGKFHDFDRLREIGVRRLSVGSGPARYIADKVIGAARAIKAGNPEEILACGFSYGDVNRYFTD